jgi:ankyrin repeat protein
VLIGNTTSSPSTKERMNRIDQELFEATGENNVAEVRRLLSVGANVNAETDCENRVTALIVASHLGHVQVVVELLKHGADSDLKDSHGWTPLHNAVSEGQLAVVNELLSPSDSNGATTTILGKRKRRGADMEAKDNDGNTPLHIASFNELLPEVKALLSSGANMLAPDIQGLLPIHKAMSRGTKSEVAKYLMQQFYATICGLPLHELVENLTWIANPNSTHLDMPPLRVALHLNAMDTDDVVEIVEFLVGRNPAFVSSRDQDGSLPLHLACRRGAPFAIVQSLANLYKASVKIVTPRGELPLFLACEMSQTSLDTIFFLMKLYPDLVYR